MKSHYTAKELAGLPGLPGTDRAIQIMAERQNWSWQKRSGRGGGKEYAIASLPAETQDHLKRQHLTSIINTVPAIKKPAPPPSVITTHPSITAPAQLKQWQRECMDARVGIMRIIERARPTVGTDRAINRIVDAAANGDLPEYNAANIRKGSGRTLSYGGIIKWWMTWQKSGGNPLSLAPRDTENYSIPPWADLLMQCWGRPQKPCLTDVLDDLRVILPLGITMPSYHQARAWLAKIGVVDKHRGRKSGNELKSLRPCRRRDTSHMYPGDAYTADGHCYDSEVAHPYHGRPFRPEITPIIDIATRRIVGWSCDLAESGLAVLDALRMACETFGPPAIFYTDNGSGYKNQMMTAAGTGILNRLGITPHYSRPRNPQAHGISERAHQTVLIKSAKQLCTYIGHVMDGDAARLAHKQTRKAIAQGAQSALLIEWDNFVAHINNAIQKYNSTPHRGLPAQRDPITRTRTHMTPDQAWEQGIAQLQSELTEDEWLVPANELPDLYHPAVERTVNKGEIQFGTMANGLPKRYFARELEQWHGHRVQVAYSPSDASRVWVRSLEHGQFLATAKLGGNSSEYFARTAIDEARYKRGQGRLKRLELQAEEARLEMHGPQPTVIEQHPEPVQQARIQLVQEAADSLIEQADTFELPTEPRARWRLWKQLDQRLKSGAELTEHETGFYRGWQRSADWRAYNETEVELNAARM